MATMIGKLKKINKRISSTSCDIYEFADASRELLGLYYADDMFFAIENGNPFIVFNNNQVLMFFVNNLYDMYQDDYEQIKKIIDKFNVKMIYVCINDLELDADLFSEFPYEQYIGLARNNVKQVVNVLIYEETLMKSKKVCPYCGSNSLIYHPFIKRGFISGNFSFEPSETQDATRGLDELIEESCNHGVYLSCENCCEQFEYNADTKKTKKFKYLTPISKEKYFDSISLVCGDSICKLMKVVKGNAKTYYNEDLEEIINEYYESSKDKDVADFVLNIKKMLDEADFDDDDDFGDIDDNDDFGDIDDADDSDEEV